MDLATILGLAAGCAVVCTLILLGGDFRMFYDLHAIIVIFGGSTSATLIRFPLSEIMHGVPLGAKYAFSMRSITHRDLVDEIAGLAEVVRKQSPIGLEAVEVEDSFLAKGIRYVADGYDADFIRDNLERDRDNFLTHLDEGQKIYRAYGDCAPAFGMIGTLLGMVQMFANMTDPSKLGPFMAVALLATLYGALVANLFCLPLADKLHVKLLEEEISRTLIIDGILMMRDSKSPALVREMLLAYLPEKHRHEEGSEVPARREPEVTVARDFVERGFVETWFRKESWPEKAAHGGGHGWFVTFADLMGLLMSFFVMLVAFSNQDEHKLQVVAGSMRDAFGVQNNVRYSGIIEVGGLPTRGKLKNAARIPPEEASANPSPEPHSRDRSEGVRIQKDRQFALAAASLRQALQDLPELSELSKNIMLEETQEGLNIELVDQDGRSMFPDGSKEPYERTRRALAKLAGPLRAVPYRISITGHSSASKNPSRPGYGPWELSTDRAIAVRQILEGEGVPAANFYAVSGKADTQPLFPDDPFIAANRRVTITLMREEPPIPLDFKP